MLGLISSFNMFTDCNCLYLCLSWGLSVKSVDNCCTRDSIMGWDRALLVPSGPGELNTFAGSVFSQTSTTRSKSLALRACWNAAFSWPRCSSAKTRDWVSAELVVDIAGVVALELFLLKKKLTLKFNFKMKNKNVI